MNAPVSDAAKPPPPISPPLPPRRRPRRHAWAVGGLLLLVFLVYLAAARGIAASRTVWSPDTGARLIQVQAALEHWPAWWVSYPAERLDPDHQNSPLFFYEYRYGGRTFIFYSFLFALVSAALFRVFGFLGLAVLPMLAGVATGWTVYGLGRLLRLRFPLGPLLVAPLATPIGIYSVVFWDHSVTTAIAAAALYLAVRAVATDRPRLWFGAGLVLGAGLWFHEILLPCLPALVAAAWWARKRQPWPRSAALLLAGVALLVVPLGLVNQAVYGTPAGPHLMNNRLGSPGAILRFLLSPGYWGPGALYTLFAWGDVNPGYTWLLREWLGTDRRLQWELKVSAVMAVPVILWILVSATGLWRRVRAPWGTVLSLALFAGMLATGGWVLRHGDWPHSLFFACPFLALAFAAPLRPGEPAPAGPAASGGGDDRDLRLLWQMVAVGASVYSALALLNPALGGTEWGSRYLLIAVPALTLLAWAAGESLLPAAAPPPGAAAAWRPGTKPLLGGMALLLALSLALQAHGYRVVHAMHRDNRRLADAIAAAPDEVVVSSVWWAPLIAAPVYGRKQILYAGDPDHPAVPLFFRMRQADVPGYTLIGYDPYDLSSFALQAGYLPVTNSAEPASVRLWRARYAVPAAARAGNGDR